jgi:hypothetical protein
LSIDAGSTKQDFIAIRTFLSESEADIAKGAPAGVEEAE